MKKIPIIVLLSFLYHSILCAQPYFFKQCKISDAVTGDYIINVKKNLIEVELKSVNDMVQNFSDKIKSIEKDKITSEKIKSGKGEDIFYQYFLNSKKKTVTKLEYIKQTTAYGDVYKPNSKRISSCSNVKSGWSKEKIQKAKAKEEQKEILKAQEELKKEQESLLKCQGNDVNKWIDCKGSFKAETGHKYTGLFKNGKIIKGVSLYPGGAKYVGDFNNFIPDGYGTFVWPNGDKYYGEWKNGKSQGNGTKIWQNGRKYMGKFENDKLHGKGTLFYPDGNRYEGEFINGKRHGKGTFTYSDGSAYIGNFVAGVEKGVGECVNPDGSSVQCQSKSETQVKDFSGKDTRNISIVSKKWVRISQYESNTKRGKKIMDKLKADFEIKAAELCIPKTSYKVLDKKMEVLDVDETPAYGLETKLKIGINGVVECI